MKARRPPHGPAGGALSGHYPNPGIGAPMAGGTAIFDDFVSNVFGSGRGNLNWTLATVSGTGATLAAQAVTAADEYGVSRITTPTTTPRGGTLNLNSILASLYAWSPGQVWTSKIRLVAPYTSMEAWSGFGSSLTASVRTGDSPAFIGVRYDASVGPNWYGVVKSGAGAEDTVDLGVAADNTWMRVGWRGTTSGVQFFLWATIPGLGYAETNVGAPLSRVLGSNVGPIAIGVINRTGAIRAAEVDFWSFAGSWTR